MVKTKFEDFFINTFLKESMNNNIPLESKLNINIEESIEEEIVVDNPETLVFKRDVLL
jgi:hypothetical protein